jgi:hypothetical protein
MVQPRTKQGVLLMHYESPQPSKVIKIKNDLLTDSEYESLTNILDRLANESGVDWSCHHYELFGNLNIYS